MYKFGFETCNLSIILSTAILDGAQANIFAFYLSTAYNISSTTVVVFPVPGGPWIRDTSVDDRHLSIASLYEVFNPWL